VRSEKILVVDVGGGTTLDKGAALEMIDELDHELTPWNCDWSLNIHDVAVQNLRELRITLGCVRRNVDEMYDDGDTLVTC
jgi:hypothetical protein